MWMCIHSSRLVFLFLMQYMKNVYPHRNKPITIFKYMSTTIYLKIYVWPCEYVYTHKIIPADVLQYLDVYTHRNIPTAIYFRVCLHILTCWCMFFLVWRQFGARKNALFLSLYFFSWHSRTPTRKLGQSVGRFWWRGHIFWFPFFRWFGARNSVGTSGRRVDHDGRYCRRGIGESWVMSHNSVMSHVYMSHVTRRYSRRGIDESCHTYEWVMSHKWMRHVIRMHESCHTLVF